MSDNTNRDNKNPRFGSKPPSGGDDPNQPKKGPRFSIYWIYAIIFAVLIGFQLFGPFSPTMAKTSSMEFRNMLANGEVAKYTIIDNRKTVKVYLTDSAQKKYQAQLKKEHQLFFICHLLFVLSSSSLIISSHSFT